MNAQLLSRLQQLSDRHAQLELALQSPEVTQDMEAYRRLTREHAEITPVVEQFAKWLQAHIALEHAEALLLDPEFKDLAQEEALETKQRLETLEQELKILLLPKDPNDTRNVYLEIRAGTGGEESALFAADLLRMYTRYAERRRWQIEHVSETASDLGGFREVIIRLAGDSVYSALKFESGGHRVQRVPETEAQGRIHTSACTVAVLAEADEIDPVVLRPDDLRIDVFRASGAGGQHVNRTESAVRITHLPTGLVVECQDDRSQHRNKDKAMRVLSARLQDRLDREAHAQEAATRRSLVGSGDRSERIRTYNFPQGRVTDHRINLTLYKLAAVMDGDLEELIHALATEHQAELLAQLADA